MDFSVKFDNAIYNKITKIHIIPEKGYIKIKPHEICILIYVYYVVK